MAKKNNKKISMKSRVEGEFLKNNDDPIDSWRIFKIMSEFVEGFEMIRKYNKATTFFGSARSSLDDKYYKDACELAALLSKDGFTIITGGGPGIMEAANKGAYQAGGRSVGLPIDLPVSEGRNAFVHDSFNFHYFFTRKVMLSFASDLYVYFPGGYGTLDELFELLTLVKTGKINRIPIILFGKKYWNPLLKWFDESLVGEFGTVSKEELEIYHLVDSVDEAHEAITILEKKYCEESRAC